MLKKVGLQAIFSFSDRDIKQRFASIGGIFSGHPNKLDSTLEATELSICFFMHSRSLSLDVLRVFCGKKTLDQ
jgi:hypothetical protein